MKFDVYREMASRAERGRIWPDGKGLSAVFSGVGIIAQVIGITERNPVESNLISLWFIWKTQLAVRNMHYSKCSQVIVIIQVERELR